jgi:hypothetical protein
MTVAAAQPKIEQPSASPMMLIAVIPVLWPIPLNATSLELESPMPLMARRGPQDESGQALPESPIPLAEKITLWLSPDPLIPANEPSLSPDPLAAASPLALSPDPLRAIPENPLTLFPEPLTARREPLLPPAPLMAAPWPELSPSPVAAMKP